MCATQATKLEVSMNAVERMVEYTSQAPEGAAQGPCRVPPSDWPETGAIVVQNLQVCLLRHQHPLGASKL